MWSMELRGTGFEGLVETERPQSEAGAGEVLVRVRAASINYRDLALVRGEYGALPLDPLVPLSDGAGEVVSAGEGVTRFRPGDRVIFAMRPEWREGRPTRRAVAASLGMTLDGVLAEYRVAREHELVRTPEHLSDEQAASLPIAAVTAWTALVVNGNLRAGEWVVIQGTGGVSLFALQFASRLGARTIVLSSSDEKLERAKQLGATHTINYRTTPRWDEAAIALTGGEGAEHVLDIGGRETLERSLEALRPGGNLYLVGFVGGMKVELDLPKILRKVPVVRGLSVGPIEAFEQMNEAIEEWKLEPVIDRTFERGELKEALMYLADGAPFGKVVLRVG
jgi:NADPH:quinone reductase-like Zn-dependent oxidoreductase